MNSDAEYFQQHKDDEAEWDDADDEPQSIARSETRRLAAMISVRFAPNEVDLVRDAAASEGLSLSGFVRNAALRARFASDSTQSPPRDRELRGGHRRDSPAVRSNHVRPGRAPDNHLSWRG